MIVISYDGSPDAQAAIDRAAELMNGAPATVVTVWESFLDVVARTGWGGIAAFGATATDSDELDAESAKSAEATAAEGAERALRAGLQAESRARRREGTIAETILSEADDVSANLIVVGTRGRSGLKSLLLGSVSHAVLQHADRPVMVALSRETAAERAAHRRG